MNKAQINISLDPQLLSKFYEKDSSLGTLENPFKADNFCVVKATGIKATGIHNVFAIEPNTSYNFNLISTNESVETIKSVKMSISMIQEGLPDSEEWSKIFNLDNTEISDGEMSIGNKDAADFTLETVDNIECNNNLQYNINFTFELDSKTKYGVIDPLIANTSEDLS